MYATLVTWLLHLCSGMRADGKGIASGLPFVLLLWWPRHWVLGCLLLLHSLMLRLPLRARGWITLVLGTWALLLALLLPWRTSFNYAADTILGL